MKRILIKLLPLLLVLFGFFALNSNGNVGTAIIIFGVVMAIERKWPEKWGTEKQK